VIVFFLKRSWVMGYTIPGKMVPVGEKEMNDIAAIGLKNYYIGFGVSGFFLE